MKHILALKRWLLILLIIVPSIFVSASPWKEIAVTINGLVYLIWVYSIGYFGQQKIKELSLKPMNLKWFQINLCLLPCLIIVSGFITPNQNEIFGIKDIFIAALGIYSAIAVFQVLFFAAKTLAKVELKREVFFSDFFLNFIQLTCFVFGIWIIQPKVNRLFISKSELLP